VWLDTVANKDRFLILVKDAGLQALQGGRFLTVAGDTDKGQAVSWLRSYYQQREGRPVKVIALGDSPNDEAMLNAADIAVIIKSDKSSQIQADKAAEVIRTEQRGPEGWCAAITSILSRPADHIK
jgi:mannosyl-3-phosphoglycerate phosphatase